MDESRMPQDAKCGDSEPVASQGDSVGGRPDLEALRGAAEPALIYSDTQGWLAGHLVEVIDYATRLERVLAAAREDRDDFLGGLQSAQALIVAYAEWVHATFPIDTEQNGAEQALLDYAAVLARGGGEG